jgi:hypothetical protein
MVFRGQPPISAWRRSAAAEVEREQAMPRANRRGNIWEQVTMPSVKAGCRAGRCTSAGVGGKCSRVPGVGPRIRPASQLPGVTQAEVAPPETGAGFARSCRSTSRCCVICGRIRRASGLARALVRLLKAASRIAQRGQKFLVEAEEAFGFLDGTVNTTA